MLLTDTLIKNPNSFLRKLSPAAMFIDEPPGYSPGLKTMLHTKLEAKKAVSIIGLDRIAFCSINQMASGNIYASVHMDSQPGFRDTPCYWLPWMKDGIVRIKLRPSRHLQFGHQPETNPYQQGTKSHGKVGMGQSLNGEGVQISDFEKEFHWKPRTSNRYDQDVRLFFTGMMDGCTTWVAGDPKEPEVYHVNCASYNATANRELLRKGVKGEMEGNQDRMAQMEENFLSSPGEKNVLKKALGSSSNPINSKQLVHNPTALKNFSEKDSYNRIGSEAVRRIVKGERHALYKVNKQLYTAFGVKDSSGNWSFYRQTIYQYRKSDAEWNASGPKLSAGDAPVKFFP